MIRYLYNGDESNTPAALRTARAQPELRLVVDHIAKPPVRDGEIEEWASGMAPFAGLENVYCKLSGMVTEADWKAWKPDDLKPYVQAALEAFGPDRCMYGSDWPVCLLNGTYKRVQQETLLAVKRACDEPRPILEENAERIYRLADAEVPFIEERA